jgi:Cu+-exporting ATPase
MHPLGNFSADYLLSLTAGAERGSEHPLARSLLRYAQEKNIVVPKATLFEAHPGGGIAATIEGKALLAGSLCFLQEQGVAIDLLESFAAGSGEGLVAVSIDGQAAGIFRFRDTIRPSARILLGEAQHLGLRIALLTGDRESTACAVALELGISEYHAECSPAEKARQLQQWKGEGYRTAMAGDGINDSPALAVADASLAMGAGADIAKESAGIILLRPSLEGIISSIKISRAILQVIRQNLFFAFAYNLLGIPIAAGILYPWFGILLSPMLATAAMSLSSVSVIANSLRLRKMQMD